MPQNLAEFRIIGRIGKISPREKVTYVNVASNYNRRDGEDWKTDTHWNSVVCFSHVRDQIDNAQKGDLVHITGRMREGSHSESGELIYRTELIADTFSVLARLHVDGPLQDN
ncbi:single-stranded DNA-binding protein [Novosphingobium sp. KN65.2]|uniref:single-stranded DNA-binding protein n=1 Tax=Novosphingobium sp. KN65.2 TaxID=1478134 RepID=UPI0005E1411D|nr:single-stranded DNA-binding protein [Novosphingobium sp. KN65.2]CDO38812.1 Single-strand binding protein [Novosphingobium sp. KN65.2]